MRHVELGNTGIQVSRLVLGCWGITSDFHWKDRDEDDSVGAIEAALELGVNFFDTAEMYADGESEKLLGRALRNHRDRAVIASKVAPDSMRPEQIRSACEASLLRLGTDHLDLYQTHWFADREVPVLDSWGALLDLKREGKVRAVGVCNAGVEDLRTLESLEIPVTNQLPYNLLWRALEFSIHPACRERGLGILAYSPLLHGLLAGQFDGADAVPDSRARSRHFSSNRPLARHGEAGQEQLTFETIDRVRGIAHELGRPIGEVALGWLDARPGVTGIIAGARNRQQLQRNVEGLQTPLPSDAVEALDQATESLKQALGPNPDMWQGEEGSRFR